MTPRAWLLFVLSSVIWGVPYLFIKVAVDGGVSPGFVAWARVAFGAAILLPVAMRRGVLRGLRGRGGAIAAYTATEIAVPFVLIAVVEQYISSSLAAILVATMPLLVALLSVRLLPADRPTGLRPVGLVLGLGGVVACRPAPRDTVRARPRKGRGHRASFTSGCRATTRAAVPAPPA